MRNLCKPGRLAAANRCRDRTRSVKPEWRGSGLLNRSQVARNHPGPPFRTRDPSGKGPGLLNRRESYVGSSPTWSSNSSARGEIGRRTILRGWRETMSVRLRPSAPLPYKWACDAAGERNPLSTDFRGVRSPCRSPSFNGA
jgi:hypothetical protein